MAFLFRSKKRIDVPSSGLMRPPGRVEDSQSSTISSQIKDQDVQPPRLSSVPPPVTTNSDALLYPWSQRRFHFTINHPSPFPRYGAAVNAVASKDGGIYMMGGLIDGSKVKGDLWMVETDESNVSCYPISTVAEGPGPRVGHASLLVGNAFIIFGGETKTHEHDEDDDTLYLLNTGSRIWTRVINRGVWPAARYGHTLNIIGSKLYVFGGQVGEYFFNDLLAFDLNALGTPGNQWEVLIPNTANGPQPAGSVPPARTNHTMVDWDAKLYLFGGTNATQWFNDVWTYDPRVNQWTQLDCIGYIPIPREGHAAALVGDIMYIFGGRSQEGLDLHELAALRISSGRWYAFHNMGPSPSPRSGHSMTVHGKQIFVMGGEPGMAPRNRVELALLYVLDTGKIRYPNDQALLGASAQHPGGADQTQTALARKPLSRDGPGAVDGRDPRRITAGPHESLISGSGPYSRGLGLAAGAAASGPPPAQPAPPPRTNGLLPTPPVPRSKTPTRVDRGMSPGADAVRSISIDREGVQQAEPSRPTTDEPRDTPSQAGLVVTQDSATSKTLTPGNTQVMTRSSPVLGTKGGIISDTRPLTPIESNGSIVSTEDNGLPALAPNSIHATNIAAQPITHGVASNITAQPITHDIASLAAGVDLRLASFFSPNARKSYTDSEILEISSLLKHTRNDVWSQVPRTYIVLRTIGYLNLLNEFISLGFTDHWFPVSLKQLPHSLSPTVKSEIVKMQSLILTKSVDLEKGDGGRHHHFARGEPVPFKFMNRLGTGGFGQVDRVLSLISYKEYALKRIRRQNMFGKGAMKATKFFIGEVNMLKRLRHHHAVEFIGSYTDTTYFAIIMSPVAEMDLAAYLGNPSVRKLPELRTFFGCLAHALDYLHNEQIRHKDIKPSNILLNQGNILLTDFGLAYDFTDATGSTTSGATALSPRYCAPEVVQYEKRNTSADIWSLGCVFFEMFLMLKGQTLDDMKAFFGEHGSQEPYIRTNLQAFAELLAELEGIGASSDNKAISWLKGMCQIAREARPTAAALIHDITAINEYDERGRNFCGICCLDSDGTDAEDSLDGLEEEIESLHTGSASATLSD